MTSKHIVFISWIFLMIGAPLAIAEQPQTIAAPTIMSDDALASYISGRLEQALSDEDRAIDQYCDASGCAVVVQ